MIKSRIVKYAGFSRVVEEAGEVAYNFHVSNNLKYAVWAAMPTSELGDGRQVTFRWFKMPENTEKLSAVRTLLNMDVVKADTALVSALSMILAKAEPKPKAPRVPKAPKERKVRVTVKKDAPKASSTGIDKIREAAKAFAEKKAKVA